jgi:hypothetical protein
MPTRLSNHNGNEPSPSITAIFNYSPDGSFSRLALIDGKSLTVRVVACPSRTAGSSAAFPSSDSDYGSSDDDGADPYLEDYTPPESRRAGLRANKWRGQRPDGSWRTRARLIDFTDSADIEESIPPYSDPSGRRYGQHRFPISRLKDENGNPIEDEIACYRLVTLWRKLSPTEQKIEVDAIRASRKEAIEAKKARKKAREKKQKKRKAE